MGRLGLDYMDPWREWFFSGLERPRGLPALNVYLNENEVIVTAELPGLDPAALDIQVQGDSLSLKGVLKPLAVEDGRWQRRERYVGEIYRTVRLPWLVEGDKAAATYSRGVLEIRLPRAEADRPRAIKLMNA